MQSKTAFVISPIGAEGSTAREHADDVFDYIIKPAMDECGVRCLRADHLQEPGKLSEQMFREIYTSDLCIALLTLHNPNVYYELALAQAWGRPVIILIEQDQVLPFDVQDMRCVIYDLRPRNLFERVHVQRLIAHLKTLEQLNWRVPPLFAQAADAKDSSTSDAPRYFERFSTFGGSQEWLQMLSQSESRCDLLSVSLDSWKGRSGFGNFVQRFCSNGGRLRLLNVHPQNPALETFGSGPLAPGFVRPSIELAANFYRQLARQYPSIEFRQLSKATPHARLIVTDKTAFISPYLYGNSSSPLWQAPADSILYQTIVAEFNCLWDAADA